MAVLGAAGGGGAISNFPITFAESGTWTCPAVMEAYVFVIGGGGSGAAVAYKADGRVQGGTAGGCAVSKLTLAAQDYVIVIGAGGDFKTAVATGSNVEAGAVGAASTFTDNVGSIATMTGNGGLGGNCHATDDIAAVAGGTATGGTIMNNTGGAQPAITVDTTVSSGGAVGLWETGRIAQTMTSGTSNPQALLQGNDDEGINMSPTGIWGKQGSWFAPPLNVATNYAQVIEPTTVANGNKLEVLPGGAKSQGQWAFAPSATYLYNFYSSPLSGGTGATGNYQYIANGGVSLGAGGGGALSIRVTSTTISGGGGHGGVIIIPISLGS